MPETAATTLHILITGFICRATRYGIYMNELIIIGGGLAGSEAAWQAARLGCRVVLYEMKPLVYSPAHNSPLLAELVCSNSLRSGSVTSAVGLLKEEMRFMGSLIIEAA